MDPFIGEIRLFSFQKVPTGWFACQGQLLDAKQYQALFVLLSNQYGGDGKTTFGLPDLRGRVPVHFGMNPVSNTVYSIGRTGGIESVTLTSANMPVHNHTVNCYDTGANTVNPNSAFPAVLTPAAGTTADMPNMYMAPTASQTTVALSAAAISTVGGGAAHENRQPYIAMNYCIAAVGMYPPRNW